MKINVNKSNRLSTMKSFILTWISLLFLVRASLEGTELRRFHSFALKKSSLDNVLNDAYVCCSCAVLIRARFFKRWLILTQD